MREHGPTKDTRDVDKGRDPVKDGDEIMVQPGEPGEGYLEKEVVPAPKEVVHDPNGSIGLKGASGQIEWVDIPNSPRVRTFTIGGANWEHVDTDEGGCWIYRAM